MNEGKLIRYLSYAVGEVLLIIIGILMALKINDWNEEKKAAEAEREILSSFREELIANRERLEKSFERSNALEASAYRIIELGSQSHVELSTTEVDELVGSMCWWVPSQWVTSTVDTMVSSGDISLIQDKDMQRRISTWIREINLVKAMEEQAASRYHDYFIPFLMREGRMAQINNSAEIIPGSNEPWIVHRTMPIKQTVADHRSLIKNQEFQNIIVSRHWDHQDLRETYGNFENQLEQLLKHVELELAD